MLDQEQLKLLLTSVEKWNAWRLEHAYMAIDLQGAKLEGANLQNAYLRGADLQAAKLEGANLYGARLRDANLQDADLQGADLQGANLDEANFHGAKLEGVILDDAKQFAKQRERDAQPPSQRHAINQRIVENHAEISVLAGSLAQMARAEIERLSKERPNDAVSIQNNQSQRDLLTIFAEGFEKITVALAALQSNSRDPILLGKASDVVNSVIEQLDDWWSNNKADAVDWAIKLPVMAAGVAILSIAGGDEMVSTTVVAAYVGGKKVIQAMKGDKKSE